jgi:secreted PhoX family phosphatase
MLGRTHGKRSAVTCHLKCADACSQPVPNTSGNEYFRDVAAQAISRRALLGGAGAGALALVLAPTQATSAAAAPAGGVAASGATGSLAFTPIAPVSATVDAMTVPQGYQWGPIIRWGDPLFTGAPEFDAANQSAAAQAQQFGYNNDYLDIMVLDGEKGRRAVLVTNHEYTNENLMFPLPTADTTEAELQERMRIAMAAHGMSVVELRRSGPGMPWEYQRHGHLNRRVTVSTPFAVDGPAAGSDLLKTQDDPTGTEVLGTLNNCAGGTTPWGTVVSGEENFNQYFVTTGDTPELRRYGLGAQPTSRGWEAIEPRFDARRAGYANEPNRFGWIVEIDPQDPKAPPVKHTALGRFKHEGANITVAPDGRVVAYMGDDERFDYVYKFVSRDRMAAGDSKKARAHNKTLLSNGDLYAARFTGDGVEDGVSDGTGEWLPLVVGGQSMVPGFSVERVLVYTRLAADAVGATKMDRPEDVEPNPETGAVYVACTNNTDRGKPGKEGATEVGPRTPNKDGHVVEILETAGDPTSLTFSWNLFLICGDAASAGTYFGGWTGPVAPISCPDNVAFDSKGNLWISTDGQPGTIGLDDALFKVPVTGPERGHVQQFLAVPVDAETCGPLIHDRDGMVFVAVQHPGEDGSFEAPRSYFPDYVPAGQAAGSGRFAGPRPAVVQVWGA